MCEFTTTSKVLIICLIQQVTYTWFNENDMREILACVNLRNYMYFAMDTVEAV
jgi:hypothetical protein